MESHRVPKNSCSSILFKVIKTDQIVSDSDRVRYCHIVSELQKVGILVSRIPDISGRKFGHFHNVATNLSILWLKKIHNVNS